MYEKKLTLLIADDELKDRKLIKAWLAESIDLNKVQILECEEWHEAVQLIQDAADDPIDLVFTDIVFEQEKDGYLGGHHIAAAAVKNPKTCVVLISKNWHKPDVLNVITAYPGRVQALPKNEELKNAEFEVVFVPLLKKWCAFQASRLDFTQREALKKLIHQTNLTGDETVEVSAEAWKLRHLYPHLDWQAANRANNYREVASYLIRYPSVNKDSWLKARKGNNFYELPIVEYYQEFYFNPLYQGRLADIEANATKLLLVMLNQFVGQVLRDEEKQRLARRQLTGLFDQSDLVSSYKAKLNGRDYAGQIPELTMDEFIYKLTGRLIALGAYLLLDFTREQIDNALINGHFSLDGSENARQLFSEYFYILSTSNEQGTPDRYKKYRDIYCACSDDERSMLKNIWQKMQDQVAHHLGLSDFEQQEVKAYWQRYMGKSLNLEMECLNHGLPVGRKAQTA